MFQHFYFCLKLDKSKENLTPKFCMHFRAYLEHNLINIYCRLFAYFPLSVTVEIFREKNNRAMITFPISYFKK